MRREVGHPVALPRGRRRTGDLPGVGRIELRANQQQRRQRAQISSFIQDPPGDTNDYKRRIVASSHGRPAGNRGPRPRPRMLCWTRWLSRIRFRTRCASSGACPSASIVIFGANGDLTKRKLHAGALPPGVRPPALRRIRRRRHLAHAADRRRSSARRCCEAVKEFSEDTKFDEDVWRGFAAGPVLYRGRHRRRRRCTAASRRSSAKSRRRGTPAATSCSIFRPSPASMPTVAAGHRQGRARQGQRLAAPDRRKAVRPRPRQRARTERPPARGLRRIRRLPHRSLPGQGDRAEYPGLPLRQRHLRAAVEPPLRESRADHRRRNRSAWKAAARITRRPARWPT